MGPLIVKEASPKTLETGGDPESRPRGCLKDFGKFSGHITVVKILDDICRVWFYLIFLCSELTRVLLCGVMLAVLSRMLEGAGLGCMVCVWTVFTHALHCCQLRASVCEPYSISCLCIDMAYPGVGSSPLSALCPPGPPCDSVGGGDGHFPTLPLTHRLTEPCSPPSSSHLPTLPELRHPISHLC